MLEKRCTVSMLLMVFLVFFTTGYGNAQPNVSKINLPPGFRIEIYAGGSEGARSLALGDDRANAVYRISYRQ